MAYTLLGHTVLYYLDRSRTEKESRRFNIAFNVAPNSKSNVLILKYLLLMERG
jgi:hypothetical protein